MDLVVNLCFMFLSLHLVLGETTIQHEEFFGIAGTYQTVASEGFGENYALDETTIYNLTFQSKDGSYIKLKFYEFDIHLASMLKIIDGYSWEEDRVTSYWLQGQPPLYSSSTDHLELIWKPNAFGNSLTTSGSHVGFGVNASFTRSYQDYGSRILDADYIAVNGYCGKVTPLSGSARSQWTPIYPSSHHGYKPLNFSCIWSEELEYFLSPTLFLAVRTRFLPNSGMYYQVKDGSSSLARDAEKVRETETLTMAEGRVEKTMVYKIQNQAFHVRMDGMLARDDIFAFHFDSSESYAVLAVQSMNAPSPQSDLCPQKTCANGGTTVDCRYYWDPCETWASEPACDESDTVAMGIKTCEDISSMKKCYSEITDKCDGFHDCYNGIDEEECSASWLTTLWNFLGPALFFLFCLVACGVVRGLFKGAKKCSECICDCCSGGCDLFKDGCDRCTASCGKCLGETRDSLSNITHTRPTNAEPEIRDVTVPRSATEETDIDYIDATLDVSDEETDSSSSPLPRRRSLPVLTVSPSAPPAPSFDPTAPPSYHDVIGDGPVTRQPERLDAASSHRDLPTYDEFLDGRGSQRVLFQEGQSGETPTVPPPSYDSIA